jgi:proline iminopeptidase
MVAAHRTREGYVSVRGGRVWYKVVGDGDAIPLIALHGGPGCPHDYLEPLVGLAGERPVVFYDQLGCGNSDQPNDAGLWRIERFVEELTQLHAALNLQRAHLLGQSWGTILAAEYALSQPSGLVSLILADPALSIPRWDSDAAALRAALPPDVRETLDRHEAAGTTDSSEEYEAATMAFYRHHLCRLDPWPEALIRSFTRLALPVYHTMWGPNEFVVTGTLKEYDVTGRLGEIAVPTLFFCGRYDEATPESTAWYHSLAPGSELVIFEESSHLPHLEETDGCLQVIQDFLRRAEAR